MLTASIISSVQPFVSDSSTSQNIFMQIFNHQQNPSTTLLIIYLLLIACNKKFDEPPVYVPPVVHATTSIAQFKANYVYGNAQQITTDDVIEGIVIANDSSGNFFK